MSNHSNKQLEQTIYSSQEMATKMDALKQALVLRLKDGCEQVFGAPIPPPTQATVYLVETVMQSTSEGMINPILAAVHGQVTAAFEGDEAVISKAVSVAFDALRVIFGNGLSAQFTVESANIEHDGEKYLAAMCAVMEVCSSQQWFTESDFTVASFVYFVTKPLDRTTA